MAAALEQLALTWMNWRHKRRGATRGPLLDARGDGLPGRPRGLILTAEKMNQNYYRDLELGRQSGGVVLAEGFDYAPFGWDVGRLAAHFFPDGGPEFVFINYARSHTWRLEGFQRLGAPVFAFVGDHYNFLDDDPVSRTKAAFYQELPLAALVTAYPHTNEATRAALARPDVAFVYVPWAVDPAVFQDLGRPRHFDIACLGAHTKGKYPFRRQVRAWLEQQRELKFFPKARVCGHSGEIFNRSLNMMRSAFTCSAVVRYTVMKYFEIPAAGALLFGETTAALTELGLVDGEHYVAVTPEDFPDKFRHYLTGPGREEGEAIRQAGNRLVRQHHTWEKRVARFLEEIRPWLG